MGARMTSDPTDMGTIFRQSQADREDADRLLDDLHLLEQWAPYGQVEAAGSYRWDLMLRSDLDLYVVNPDMDLDIALRAFNAFVHRG